MMNKQLVILVGLVLLVAISSCEPTNPFATGPVYDSDANLAIDREKIDAYLDTARIDSLYRIHDPSGVIIIVQEDGNGTRPTSGNVVYTDYIGSLMSDGSVFDTSIEQVAIENSIFVEGRNYVTFSFVKGSGGVITGWDIGFGRLRPGSKARFVIPSPYGYRNATNNSRIPANSVLLFDVDFKGID
jgi:FKBP-type peptidyl-prolyl cis-trans isomerase FkpA